ncbi:trans-homoaconitate synthase [Thermogymnomonas acidicola]|uniref:2-isopropylmalate synthase n=1 Tax=Thermogymnomonas acidicola TaxID=399579 RepID=A0AA37F9H1_9ARCH|nr:trans-homoaconitate synthase [Thermogymnomonas acidicola]
MFSGGEGREDSVQSYRIWSPWYVKRDCGRVVVFDTTLRDGEQTPGVAFGARDKVEIASALEEAGVDIIEAGFPAVSEEEMDAVAQVASTVSRSEVAALARCNTGDIERAINSGASLVHVFIATSDTHMHYKLRMNRDQVISRIRDSVERCSSSGIGTMFSPEDATRSDREFLFRAIATAVEAGARWINIPDTVGVMFPSSMFEMVREVHSAFSTDLSVHCHNDFGLATANTLFGIAAGARQMQVTVNGIGERAGNASLEECVLGAEAFLGCRTGIRKDRLYDLSRLVAEKSGVPVQPNRAIVGQNSFSHEAGIHVHGVINEPSTYEAFDPAIVGRRREVVFGKHSGINAVIWAFRNRGMEIDEEEARAVLRSIKASGGRITEDEVVERFESAR